MTNTQTPTSPSDRIVALDALRGFAILGILIMNVQSFSMIGSAYINPTAYGDLAGLNKLVWIVSHVFADKKFMTLFAMLYGAGIVLFTGRIEAKGRDPRGVHYRRTMWLIVIGLMHAYLLWSGDILVTYGMCALVVYLFRHLSPRRLLAVGLASFALGSLLYFLAGFSMPWWSQEQVRSMLHSWQSDPNAIAREVAAYRGGWLDQMPVRARAARFIETTYFLYHTLWRTGGLMIIGMAFFKWGILTGQRSKRFFASLIAAGFGIGLPLIAVGVYRNFKAGWSMEYSMFLGMQYNYWGSILVSSAYIGIVMLAIRSQRLRRITGVLASVGRMAFTNYLMQTVLCTMLFYGHGLGLFGGVERIWHPLIIVCVWTLELVWSPLWLSRFRFGPVEWLWRSLTYRSLQPMRRELEKAI
jgi:uncharacterized protein